MVIKVLGAGCASCNTLETLVQRAVDQLGLDAEVVHVSDFAEIMAYGVMSTPALVIDEKVVLAGGVPSIDKVTAVIQRAAG